MPHNKRLQPTLAKPRAAEARRWAVDITCRQFTICERSCVEVLCHPAKGANVMFSTWIYLAVAAVIAAVAFGIGQFVPGLGVAFVVLASAIWNGYSVNRQKNSKAGF
jgi:hypothetical protein